MASLSIAQQHSPVIGLTFHEEWLVVAVCMGTPPTLHTLQRFAYPQQVHDALQLIQSFSTSVAQHKESAEVWLYADDPHVRNHHYHIPLCSSAEQHAIVQLLLRQEAGFEETLQQADYRIHPRQQTAARQAVTAVLATQAAVTQWRAILAPCTQAGLSLTGLTGATAHLEQLYLSGWLPMPWQTFVLLEQTAQLTRLVFIQEGHVVLTRTLRMGVQDCMPALQSTPLPDSIPFTASDASLHLFADAQHPLSEGSETRTTQTPEALLTALYTPAASLDTLFTNSRHNTPHPDRLCTEAIADRPSSYTNATTQHPDSLTTDKTHLDAALERLTRQVLLAHERMQQLPDALPLQGLVLAVPAALYPQLSARLAEALSLPCQACQLQGSSTAEARTALETLYASPLAPAVRQAVGMALASSTRTPNPLFPYQERQRRHKRNQRLRLAVAGMTLSLISLGALGVSLAGQWHDAQRAHTALENALHQWPVHYTSDDLSDALDNARALHDNAQRLASRRLGAALLATLSAHTPREVHLSRLHASFAPDLSASSARQKTAPHAIIQGNAYGTTLERETALAALLQHLESLPFIRSLLVEKQHTDQALSFTATATLLDFTPQPMPAR